MASTKKAILTTLAKDLTNNQQQSKQSSEPSNSPSLWFHWGPHEASTLCQAFARLGVLKDPDQWRDAVNMAGCMKWNKLIDLQIH